MDLIQALADLESQDAFHEARLLLMLRAFAGSDGTGQIEGLTKLAKLDFLLRYPVMLKRALERRGRSTNAVRLQPYEETSVESKMVRYRFGPWDHRYRRFLNLLAAKGLADVSIRGRTINIGITPTGLQVADALGREVHFADMAARAKTLKTHLNLTATNLMNFVYETFPEISSLRMNEYIAL